MIRLWAILVTGMVLPGQAKAPTEGLVGHWKLDEGEGDKVSDSSGKGNPGKREGGARGSTEVPKGFANSGSTSFDGKDARVNAGDAATLAMKAAFTLTAWVRPTANSDSGGIIVNREGEYEIGRSAEGKLQFALASDTPGWDWVDTSFELPLNAWTHVAWTYSAADKKIAVYANGKEVFTEKGEGEIGDTYPDQNQLWIGGRAKEGGAEYFAGQIAELRLYNRALKPEEVRAVRDASLKK